MTIDEAIRRIHARHAAMSEVERLRAENADLRRILAIYEADRPDFGVYIRDAIARIELEEARP